MQVLLLSLKMNAGNKHPWVRLREEV